LQIDIRVLLSIAGLAILVGCAERGLDEPTTPILTAATLGEQNVRPVSDYLASAPYAAADLRNGERQAQVCRACHIFSEGGAHMLGPSLHGIFGTSAGTRAGFDYSEALRSADFIWTPRALDAWLVQPGRFLPGNRMVFAGVSRASDRNDLIAYLLNVTVASSEE
jgi:cytochrome c